MLPTNPAPRKTPVKHRECMRVEMEILIPIEALDMDSIGAANKIIDEITSRIRQHKAAVEYKTRLDRRPGNLFP